MDKATAQVVRGYLSLNQDQRAEFVTKINEYNRGDLTARDRVVKESRDWVTKMDVGPVTKGCPCCGR